MTALKEFLAKADSGVENSLKEFLGGLVDSFDTVFDSLTDIESALMDKSAIREPAKVTGRDMGKAAPQATEPRNATPAPPPQGGLEVEVHF